MLAPYNRGMRPKNHAVFARRCGPPAWLTSGAAALVAAGMALGCAKSIESGAIADEAVSTAAQPVDDESDLAAPERQPVAALAQPAFDGARAYGHLQAICQLGARFSGSPGMRRQQELLTKHFTNLGGQVSMQPISANLDRRTGRPVPMANMVVVWRPESIERILLCAHYDTRPLPDQDPDPQMRRNGVFVGANDGASGVAVLMELARHIQAAPGGMGVDFVLFDAEEYVFDDRLDNYFLGSRHFAQQYRRNPPPQKYVVGVLLDMVGDARLSVYQEANSARWPDTRPIVKEIWDTAENLGVREFIPRIGYEVRDDHLPLHEIARIPVCDVIDFQYPDRTNRHWHTMSDAPENCSGESLGKVGNVILTWLQTKL